jgi:hypothetical protein
LPSNLVCYFLSTTNIRGVHYIIGTLLKAPISSIPIYVAFGSNFRGEKDVTSVLKESNDTLWINVTFTVGFLAIFGILFYFLRKRVESDFNRRMSSFDTRISGRGNTNIETNANEASNIDSETSNADTNTENADTKSGHNTTETSGNYITEEEPFDIKILTAIEKEDRKPGQNSTGISGNDNEEKEQVDTERLNTSEKEASESEQNVTESSGNFKREEEPLDIEIVTASD